MSSWGTMPPYFPSLQKNIDTLTFLRRRFEIAIARLNRSDYFLKSAFVCANTMKSNTYQLTGERNLTKEMKKMEREGSCKTSNIFAIMKLCDRIWNNIEQAGLVGSVGNFNLVPFYLLQYNITHCSLRPVVHFRELFWKIAVVLELSTGIAVAVQVV